ncbi:MAG: hypothetical protein RLZZ31_752 [Actinomycetota bacterium]
MQRAGSLSPMEQALEMTAEVATDAADVVENEEVAVEELLVEEISIDGMCGVY